MVQKLFSKNRIKFIPIDQNNKLHNKILLRYLSLKNLRKILGYINNN